VCIPLVTKSALPVATKAILAGLLALGIPELLMVVAAAILGKSGFEYLKDMLKRFLRRHGPPELVGPRRYRIGLVMFTIPLALAWVSPYAAHALPTVEAHALLYAIPGDVLLVTSLFVLGGEFWDKLRSLFVRGATVQFPEKA
jgi:hypothetical protein